PRVRGADARCLQSAPGICGDRGRPMRQHGARARRSGARLGAGAARASRRAEARRNRSAAISPRYVGRRPLAGSVGVYSPVGRRQRQAREKGKARKENQAREIFAVFAIVAAVALRKNEETVSAIPVEYASQRKIRERNKLYYRFNHWPIW